MPKVRFTPDEKAKAIMRQLQDGVAISTICGGQEQVFAERERKLEEARLPTILAPRLLIFP